MPHHANYDVVFEGDNNTVQERYRGQVEPISEATDEDYKTVAEHDNVSMSSGNLDGTTVMMQNFNSSMSNRSRSGSMR